MAIKFNCPHCQKALTVKDESLAGKKAACSGCKKIVVIPKPQPAAAAAPEVDVEALAAAALAEPKSDPAERQQSQTIDFACPQCGEQIKMSRDLAGKNAPCPECRRIIKVPQLKADEGGDWRQKDNRPAVARRDNEPVPEGAWEGKRVVSGEALVQAGLGRKKKRAVLTTRQKVYRGLMIGVPVLVLLVGGFVALGMWRQEKQDALVEKAVKAAEGQDHKTREPAAEANRAAGEYYVRAGKRDSADKAKQHLGKARDLLGEGKAKPGPGRDVMLADLAVVQVDLGGTDTEATAGMRLKWGKAMDEVNATLGGIGSPSGRLHALRLVAAKLIAGDHHKDAFQLAVKAGASPGPDGGETEVAAYEGPEAMAVVGIELFRANHKDLAGTLADQALEKSAAPAEEGAAPAALSPSLAALCLALNKPEPKPARPGDKDNLAIGRAVGLVLQGDAAKARALPEMPPDARFRALVALAEATGDGGDVEAATTFLDSALKDQPVSPWLVYRLARVAAKAGPADRAFHLAERVSDTGLKARAQLEGVRARLGGTSGPAADGALDGIDNEPLLQAQAREALARHKARGDAGGTLKAVEGWDEAVRPFGQLGAVLGAQDAKVK